jgi:hypothetical protein
LIEVGANLVAGGKFKQPPVKPGVFDPVGTQMQRVHAVVRRRSVKFHKWVGIVPMPAGLVPTIHYRNGTIAFTD